MSETSDILPVVPAPKEEQHPWLDDDTIVIPGAVRPTVIPRLRRMLDYDHPLARHYSLSKLPPDATWNYSWDPVMLSESPGGLPLKIRIIGTVVQIDSTGGELTVRLLRPLDHAFFIRVLRRGVPKPDVYPDTVTISLYQPAQLTVSARVQTLSAGHAF
ncbi:hypothetical protein FKP32DRAFT_1678388 [Trametes sanguinea]|nr:hypothetical protein FKP32DRAFT_1678388 [Trametes sanguinea]